MGAVWKKVGALAALLCFLPGCGGGNEQLQQAIDLRGQLLRSSGCGFDVTVTADYGDRLSAFSMTCQADGQGDMTFTVTAPETIAGITGALSGDGGALTFDGTALSFPLLADEQFSPVSAPWVLLKTLRSGCITAAGAEGEHTRLTIDDSYDDDALQLDIWLDAQRLPCRAEIVYDGRRVLSMELENFTVL